MALIQEIKDVSKYIIEFGEEVDNSLSNGWQWGDAWNFLDNAMAAPGAFKKVPAAWAAVKPGLSNEDRAEWVQYVKDEFDIEDDAAEEKIEAVIEWMAATEKLLQVLRKKAA